MITKYLVAAASAVLLSSNASAAVLTDIVDASPDVYLEATSSTDKKGKITWTPVTHTFVHDLLDNDKTNTYVIGTEIEKAELFITLYDKDQKDEAIHLTYGLGGNLEVGKKIPTVSSTQGGQLFEFVLNSSVADILKTGMLSVSLTANEGAFYFDHSKLNVTIKDAAIDANEVPEPASLGLLGLALAGLAAMRRRA